MDKFEYKFVVFRTKIGFDFEKKCRETEAEWNQLGDEGWELCTTGNGCVIFKRKKADLND